MINFKNETELVQIAGAAESNCNTITFINKSAPGVVINVDGYPLNSGDVRYDDGNANEKNVTKYLITASVPSFRLYIIRKIYK